MLGPSKASRFAIRTRRLEKLSCQDDSFVTITASFFFSGIGRRLCRLSKSLGRPKRAFPKLSSLCLRVRRRHRRILRTPLEREKYRVEVQYPHNSQGEIRGGQ